MNQDVSSVEQRIRRYWYVDGIGELIGGGVFVLLGLYFCAQQYFGDRSLLGGVLQSGFVLIFIGGILLGRRLINTLKTRITYPRTGYVEYEKKDGIQRRTLAMAVAVVIAMLSVIITRRLDRIDAMVAITGVLVAIILLVKQAWSSRVRRFYMLSFASLLLGMALSISGLPRGYNLGTFYGLMGIIVMISGAITLARYLRENPLPTENQNG